MLIRLSKVRDGLIYRKPTIFFETPNKNRDNLILIPSLSESTMINVLNSNLLRGENIKSIYTPFRITPMNRRRVLIPLKEYYEEIFTKTKGKFSVGRKTIPAYMNRNLIYDFNIEWRQTIDLVDKLRGENIKAYQYIGQYMYDILQKSISNAGYFNNILIVPYDGSVKNFHLLVKKRYLTGDKENVIDPATLITRAFWNYDSGTRNGLFKNIRFVVFYNTNTDALIKLDLDNLDPDILKSKYINRIIKFYSSKGGRVAEFTKDEIGNEEEIEELEKTDTKGTNIVHKNSDTDIKAEVAFEKVVKKFYEINKIKNAEIEPNSDVQDNIYTKIVDNIKTKIEKEKIEPTNIDKLIDDQEIKTNLTRYAGLKKKEKEVIVKSEENIKKEIDLLYQEYKKLPEVDVETYSTIQEYEDEEAAKDIRLKELASTPINVLSKEYVEKQFKDDILNVTSSLSNNSILPLTLNKLEFKDNSSANSQMQKLYLSYKANIDGVNKDISFSVNIPKIIDNHMLYLNGNRWTVDNQLAFLPVTKTSPDSVKITTNYSILFIDREKGYLSKTINQVLRLIAQKKDDKSIEVMFGDNLISYSENKLDDIEYSEICKDIYSIDKKGKYKLFFNYSDMANELKLMGVPEKYWKFPKDLIPIGFKQENKEDKLLFLFKGKVYVTDFETKIDTLVNDSLAKFLYEDIYEVKFEDLPEVGKRMGYTKVKIAGSHYPLILILGMVYGLKNVMGRYKIDYEISRERKFLPGFIEIKFKDTYLYYKETIANQILMSGLYFSKPHEYRLEEYNESKPYDDWISSIKKISTSTKTHFKNTMKVTLNIIVDPITQEVLNELKVPSNILDLLLYTNTMLSDNSFRPIGNVLNYRLRNYEQIAGMLNQILMKSYIDYLNGHLRGNTRNTFEVNENALISALMRSSSVNPYSALSPVLELETYSRTSQKGFMGLESSDSYSKSMREFDDNKLSVYAAGATSFGGSVGITRALTYRPNIRGIRGYITEIEDIENTPDVSMLSASELLSPFLSRHADASRQSMTIGQFKHNMPLNKGSIRLWGTGAEQVVPGLLSSDFIFKAKKEGYVNEINEVEELVELIYNDGTKDYIDISTSFIRNSANAFYTPNKLIMRLKKGDKFKKNEIIAYNDVFFKDSKNGRVELLVGTLAKIAVAPIDNSFEDSTIITKGLSEKTTSRVVIPEFVSLTPTTNIKNMKKIGDMVDETTPIIEFDDLGDNSLDGFLKDSLMDRYGNVYDTLASSERLANFHGVIKDIEVFYNVDKEYLNASLVKLINSHKGKFEKKLNFVGKENVYKLKQRVPEKQHEDAKEDGENYTGVLIKFYIQSNVPMGIGDKISFDTALKGVVSNILDDSEAPYSEYRPDEEIEAILTPTGVFSRMTQDLFYILITNKLLVELGRQIADIRDGKK